MKGATKMLYTKKKSALVSSIEYQKITNNFNEMKNNIFYAVLSVLFMATFSSCEDIQDYDISWPQPVITEVSSYSQPISSTITLKGNFIELKGIYFGSVAGDKVKVAADGQSLTVDVPRTMNPEGSPIVVVNEYSQRFETPENFVPIIPATSVTKVSEIQEGFTFVVEGSNVDLLTDILVNGHEASVISKAVDKIVVSVAGIDLKAGSLADVSFKSLAKNDIPTFEKINVVYQFITYKEVVVWDFADGTHQYVGEGTATVKTGDVLGKQANYFSLRAPGYGWDKPTGNMASEQIPDISGLTNPFITFAVRTPVGSAGYFELQDQNGNWRHFGYGHNTGGEWVIITKPLNEGWEGGEFNSGAFKPKLGFKAGNAGTQQDLDIAFVKITEGKYDGSVEIGDPIGGTSKPNLISVMNFDTPSEWPDIFNGDNKVGSLDFRNTIEPFVGSGFFTYTDDQTPGGWGAYWSQTISKETKNEDLTVFDNPYLSFALNTISSPQYIIVRVFQYGQQLEMAKKFFPNTSEKWETFEFSLFQTDLENWSKGDTDLAAHYKSLKRLNPFVAVDKIEIIVGRNDNNPIGISIDEIVITEGPRYNN